MFLPKDQIDADKVTIDQITPELLRDKVAFKGRRGWSGQLGYDETEVDDFLDLLADFIERLLASNEELSRQLARHLPGEALVVIDHPWSPTMVEKPMSDRYEEIGVTHDQHDA